MLSRALQDARQGADPALRQEALAWLWVCCPDVADELGLATAENRLAPQLAVSYLARHNHWSAAEMVFR